jgi:Flp pilus assembly protein TadG
MPSRKEHGQVIVEFAIVLSLFLVLCFGAFDMAQILLRFHELTQSAREGARVGSVTRNPASPAGMAQIRDKTVITLWMAYIDPGDVQIQIQFRSDPTGSLEMVVVTLSMTFQEAMGRFSILPFLNSPTQRISTTVTMPIIN